MGTRATTRHCSHRAIQQSPLGTSLRTQETPGLSNHPRCPDPSTYLEGWKQDTERVAVEQGAQLHSKLVSDDTEHGLSSQAPGRSEWGMSSAEAGDGHVDLDIPNNMEAPKMPVKGDSEAIPVAGEQHQLLHQGLEHCLP